MEESRGRIGAGLMWFLLFPFDDDLLDDSVNRFFPQRVQHVHDLH